MTELHIITLSDITDINVLSLKDGHFLQKTHFFCKPKQTPISPPPLTQNLQLISLFMFKVMKKYV